MRELLFCIHTALAALFLIGGVALAIEILVRWVGPGACPCFDDGQWGRLRYLGDAVRGDGNTFAAVGLT